MTRTGSADLNGVDDDETPGIEPGQPLPSDKIPGTWGETETNAAGDLIPRKPDDA